MNAFFRKLGWLDATAQQGRRTSRGTRSSIWRRKRRSVKREGWRRTRPDGRRAASWATSRWCRRTLAPRGDGRSLEQLGQDLRYAFRTMAANRLFTLLAVSSLALGIGANTAIYSFMDAILLRSLPVADPESLVVLNWHAKPRTARLRDARHERHDL